MIIHGDEKRMKCPRCQEEVKKLIDSPPESVYKRTCPHCARLLWGQYDDQIENSTRARNARPRHKNEPTERHEIIAEIAQSLGANVTADDVKKVYEAARVEYQERTGRPAAGGRAKHDPRIWDGLREGANLC